MTTRAVLRRLVTLAPMVLFLAHPLLADLGAAWDVSGLAVCNGGPAASNVLRLFDDSRTYSGTPQVTLSIDPATPGLVLEPSSITPLPMPPSTQVFNFTVRAAGAPLGAVSVRARITDSARGIDFTRSFTVLVKGVAADVSPQQVTLAAGSGVPATLTLSLVPPIACVTQPVSVSFFGLPGGVTATPATVQLTPPSYGAVTVSLSASAQARPIDGATVLVSFQSSEISLQIPARITVLGAGADLQTTVTLLDRDPADPKLGYAVFVKNLGPETAHDVRLGVNHTAASQPDVIIGTANPCAKAPDVSFACAIGDLGAGDSRDLGFYLAPEDPAKFEVIEVFAAATATSRDPNPVNDRGIAFGQYVACGDTQPQCAFWALLACSTTSTPAPGLVSGLVSAATHAFATVVSSAVDVSSLYRLRDEVFASSAAGRRYTELYYAHTGEVAGLLLTNPAFRDQFSSAYQLWKDSIAKLVNGQGSVSTITQAQVDALLGVVHQLEALGSADLKAVLLREEAALNLPSLVGKSMDQALAQQQTTAPVSVTVPAAASIHGLNDAFFHSDLRVLNPSSSAPATVTARYRCFTGPCPSDLQRTFTVAPGELKVYEDVVVGLFAAPETAGAVELTGAVLAESRVYTPSQPAPTTGSDVPGLAADEAYAESVLTSLSRSADGSLGFRTNLGIYNPNADGVTVTVSLHAPAGNKLGELTKSLGGLSATQVNDVFAAAGVTTDVPNAYAVVKADGGKHVFTYATVIDNQSQDSVFIKGRNARGDGLLGVTIPAAASIHGLAPAFFHSDVRIFNADANSSRSATLRYRCFTGPCPSTLERKVTIAPREMKVLDDAVATLFAAPETAGAIEIRGDVLADSRVYTPTRPAPTTGTSIPGAADADGTTEAVLLSLANSADRGKGFRTNVGVYNPGALDLNVTISLRRPDGSELGSVARNVPSKTSVQVNDVFAAAGVATDVPASYARVTGDGALPFFAYATVIDNQSQDSLYSKGKPLRAP